MSRTILTLALGAALGAGGLALAQHAGHRGSTVKALLAKDLPEPFGGKATRVTMVEVSWGPGGASPAHRHPGPVFGYVLEGEFETRVEGEPLKRLKVGDTFYEPAMALHAVSRNPSKSAKARILAVMVHPRDAKQLVIPEKK